MRSREAPTQKVYAQVMEVQPGDVAAGPRTAPRDQHLEAGKQLLEGKGFDQVVVGTGAQAPHAVINGSWILDSGPRCPCLTSGRRC